MASPASITSLLAALLLCTASASTQAKRLACLGDSITFGARIPSRAQFSYPAQLAARLGSGFEVRNFGVGGATLARKGDKPYATTREFTQALGWKPDIAIIQLGTNDSVESSRRKNWQHRKELEADTRWLVERLRQSNPAIEILLVAPSPMFPKKAGLSDERRRDLEARAPRLREVSKVLARVARQATLRFFSLDRVLRASDVSDGVHPTSFGAERMANVYTEALRTPVDKDCDLDAAIKAKGIEATRSDFHGFLRLDFALGDTKLACTLVVPHAATYDRQWIWRMRFFGHEPALDLALLDRGLHLFYCDVAGLFGAPAAIARMEKAYAFVRTLGLHPHPILEGMSRGGLPAVNWAHKHPGRASALYLDNPVGDFRSWPGGKSGKRHDASWRACLEAYGLDEDSVGSFDRMPVDIAAKLAARRLPLFLVYGAEDRVVPPRENGLRLAAHWLDANATHRVWVKPEAAHHPHGLEPVDPLLRHVLRAIGRSVQPAVQAVPSVEHRGRPAGWGGGTWWNQWEALRTLVSKNPDVEVVFLGDSITQGLTGHRDRLARPGGKRAFDRAFKSRKAVSLGLSGDRTEHVLWRIENGQLDGATPAVIVLTIGTNNINARQHTGSETAEGIAAIVRVLRARQPEAKILVLGCFPLGRSADDVRRLAVSELHKGIRTLADDEAIFYRDLRSLFVDEFGEANDRLGSDGIHLTAAGYKAWLGAIAPLIDKLTQD